ncbi:MAG TPA: hypothetical protein VFM95_09500, partial [Microcella sp.]|nr:hypothetical protein [Microcella sp.]
MESAPSIARVVLDSPLPQLDRLFDYRIPPTLREIARPGTRVIVPLRSAGRRARGYIVELADRVGAGVERGLAHDGQLERAGHGVFDDRRS